MVHKLSIFKTELFLLLVLYALSTPAAIAQTKDYNPITNSEFRDRYKLVKEKSIYYDEIDRDSALIKLKTIIDKSSEKAELAESYYLIGCLYTYSSEPDTAVDYLSKAEKISTEINYREIKFLSINNLGMVSALKNNNIKGLDYFNRAYREAEHLKDTTMLNMVSNNLGIMYLRYDLYEEALKWYNTSRLLMESTAENNPIRMRSHLTNIGLLYYKLNMNQKAIDTWHEAISYSENGSSALFNNLATIYREMERYDKALEYAEKAIEHVNDTSNMSETTIISRIHAIEGKMFILPKIGRSSEAITYAKDAIKIGKKHQLNSDLVNIYNFLGKTYMDLNQGDSALTYFRSANNLLNKTENLDQHAETLKNLSDVYELKGKPFSALKYLKAYNNINDSIIAQGTSKQAEKVKVLINYRDIETENQQLKLENEVKNLKITRDKNLRITLISVLALILIIIGYTIKIYFIKKNQNQKLHKLVALKTKNLNDEITAKDKLNEQLVIEKEHAEESDRLKSAFLLNMSHEIRTPMNGILGFSNLLQEKDLTKQDQDEYTKIINKAGDRLLNTINDIINISKIDSNLAQISTSRVNISDMINNLCNFFQPQCEEKGIHLHVDENIRLSPIIMQTDNTKVNSIFTNLIKNAIKFTDTGTISIGANKINGYQEFFVSDTGMGIAADRQDAIFDRFVQADIEDKAALEGSGLGLTIAKSYVNMLGGTIWVKSELGEGSTFSFTLPIKENTTNQIPEKTVLQNQEKEANVSLPHKMKILIAEDDQVSFLYLRMLLSKYNCEIIHCKNGKEAVDKCKTTNGIDLIMMDIKMPEMDGYEATREIRRFNKDVYIIFQSAHVFTMEQDKAISAGGNHYITKPIDRNKLFNILNEVKKSLIL